MHNVYRIKIKKADADILSKLCKPFAAVKKNSYWSLWQIFTLPQSSYLRSKMKKKNIVQLSILNDQQIKEGLQN